MISAKEFKEKIINIKDQKKILIIAVAVMLLVFVLAKLLLFEIESSKKDLIEMKSGSLQYAAEVALDDKNITRKEAAEVTTLDLSETSVVLKNFSEFRYFENVEVIIINDSTIDSLAGIENLKKLKEIRISNSKLTDYDNIKNTDIMRLSLIRCGLEGTVGLGKMPFLEYLNLSDNYIESLKGTFPKLIVLNLTNNEIRTIDALDIPFSTEELNLSGNPIDTIAGLEKYDNIKTLKLGNTRIRDLSVIKEMKGVNALYIDKEDMSEDLEYLYDNFRNGDSDRKKEYISRLYDLE